MDIINHNSNNPNLSNNPSSTSTSTSSTNKSHKYIVETYKTMKFPINLIYNNRKQLIKVLENIKTI